MTALNRIRMITNHLVDSASFQEEKRGVFLQNSPVSARSDASIERASRIVNHLAMSAKIAAPKLANRVIQKAPPLPPRRPPSLPPRPPSSIIDIFHQTLRSFLIFFNLIKS